MKKNQGTVDRALRIGAGIILLSLVFIGSKTALGYIGIIPLLIGIFGVCPLYSIMGVNHCPIDKK